jgi:hypothetical protein
MDTKTAEQREREATDAMAAEEERKLRARTTEKWTKNKLHLRWKRIAAAWVPPSLPPPKGPARHLRARRPRTVRRAAQRAMAALARRAI